ncbi:MAG: sensor histidine kinase KdpD [Myxococcales bacterium]|nr:sensor histidine kinase KdpD [Myxococcales bacterium]
MSDARPDPDRLLAALDRARPGSRGRLKVFLGAAAGVGKTVAMLRAARLAVAEGRDVVVGVVETHGRAETAAEIGALEVLPRRVSTRAGALPDLDLDAVLARRPEVVVVDELAHSVAPGGRHAKRWQEVSELVDAGVEVWTAMNIQHLESHNDVVERLTGVRVGETVPDHVLDGADEIEVIDLTPEDLRARLEAGRVYRPEQARRALDGFFRRGNLLALRQLALRHAASRVGEQVDDYRDRELMGRVWAAAERLLVAVGPSPLSARLVRVASRMARALDVPWHAVTVEPLHGGRPEAQARALGHLRLAEQLGAETASLTAAGVAEALVGYARQINATLIVLGAPARRSWRERLRESPLDGVIRLATDVEVHVVPTDAGAAAGAGAPVASRARRLRVRLADLGLAAAPVALASGLAGWLAPWLSESDVIMVYLAAVIVASFRLSRVASLLSAVLAVLAFNFFFTAPRFTLFVNDSAYWLTFLIVGGVGLLVASLAARAREQAQVVAAREGEARELYRLARRLGVAETPEAVAEVAADQLHRLLGADVVVLLPAAGGLARVAARGVVPDGDVDRACAEWVAQRGEPAGPGTATLVGAELCYLPLLRGERVVGVIGVRPRDGVGQPEQRHLIATVAALVSELLDRLRVEADATAARVSAETERVRSTLLSSVSHDLRTPLAAITGAATTLLDRSDHLDAATRAELLTRVAEEARRLARLLDGVLHMTRLDSGSITPALEWEIPAEIAGTAAARVAPHAAGRALRIDAPAAPFLARLDAVLVEQLLVNYLDNALVHGEGPIDLTVREAGGEVVFEVADRGPGLPAGDPARLFQKFVRGDSRRRPGAGLGLAICKAIAGVHGGAVWAAPRAGGGAVFGARFPRGDGGEAPRVESILGDPVEVS